MNPWKLAVDKYAVGSIVEGKVVRMVPFGAFVELYPASEGSPLILRLTPQRERLPLREPLQVHPPVSWKG